MRFQQFTSAQEFLDAVEVFLLEREAENNLMLGLARRLADGHGGRSGEAPLLGRVVEGETTLLAAARWPGHRLVLTRGPGEAVEVLARALRALGEEPPGVIAPSESARLFYAAWMGQGPPAPPRALRAYQLRQVIPPLAVTGRLAAATAGDAEIVAEWVRGFCLETGTDASDADALAQQVIGERRLHVWLDPRPVSMACWTGSTPNGVRINLVYTPAALRGQGYASACVAALSRQLLASGRTFCYLFTDLANATSNSIYQKIGYEGVSDFLEYDFE